MYKPVLNKIMTTQKQVKVKKHNLNNYEFYMNLRTKTPINVRISFKGNC